MNRQQEKILIAALCGLVITAAGALAVQPAMATGHAGLAQVGGPAHAADAGPAASWHAAGSTTPLGGDFGPLRLPTLADR